MFSSRFNQKTTNTKPNFSQKKSIFDKIETNNTDHRRSIGFQGNFKVVIENDTFRSFPALPEDLWGDIS